MPAPDFSVVVDPLAFAELVGTIIGIAASIAALSVVVRGCEFVLSTLKGGAVEGQRFTYSHEYDDATFKSIMRHQRRASRRSRSL